MRQVLILVLVSFLLASCASTRKIAYLQDELIDTEQAMTEVENIRFQKGDQLIILVNSKDPEVAALFNLSRIQRTIGSQQYEGNYSNGQTLGYIVNSNGEIDFPVLGKIKIDGMTREQVAEFVKSQLIEKELIKDPVITVEYQNLGFSILGEVAKPGRYYINKDQISIMEALGMAGDLTIQAQRDKVYLTRTDGKKRMTYQLDLRTNKIYNSPAFSIQQNDVIYVAPNKLRANQSTANGNTLLSAPFWVSVASFLTTLIVVFTK